MAKKQAQTDSSSSSNTAPAPAPAQGRFGGSFAPPLGLEKVAEYRELAEEADDEVREIMLRLCDVVEKFHETGPSRMPNEPHPVGPGYFVRQLEPAEKERLKGSIPYGKQLDYYAAALDGLPTGTGLGPVREMQTPDGRTYLKQTQVVQDEQAKRIRDAAFHLLWFAKELQLGREPATTELLGIGEFAPGAQKVKGGKKRKSQEPQEPQEPQESEEAE